MLLLHGLVVYPFLVPSEEIEVADSQILKNLFGMLKQEEKQEPQEEENSLFLTQVKKACEEITKPKDVEATVPIFMYHFVREDTGDYMYPENMMSPAKLKQQLEYLKQNQYEPIWITDLENLHRYQKPVALTFDDGYEDFYMYAFPLFKEYQMKASLYIIEDMTNKEGYCKDAQIKEMLESGLIQIDSHTITHRRLATLSVSEMEKELKQPREFLKNSYGIDSQVICYPYGSYNKKTVQLSQEVGYTYGLRMDGGLYYTKRDPIYEIPRIYANRSMSMNEFKYYCEKSVVTVK